MEKEQPIQPHLQKLMNDLARILDENLNPGLAWGEKKTAFALFLFPFGAGDDHRSNYISNASREDMLATLKEFIARREGRYQEPAERSSDADGTV